VKWTPDDPATVAGYHLYYRPKGSCSDCKACWQPVDTSFEDPDHDGTWTPGGAMMIARFADEETAEGDGVAPVSWTG